MTALAGSTTQASTTDMDRLLEELALGHGLTAGRLSEDEIDASLIRALSDPVGQISFAHSQIGIDDGSIWQDGERPDYYWVPSPRPLTRILTGGGVTLLTMIAITVALTAQSTLALVAAISQDDLLLRPQYHVVQTLPTRAELLDDAVYQQALRLYPEKHRELRRRRARALLAEEQIEAAYRLYRELLQEGRHTMTPGARLGYGVSLCHLGRYHDALATLSRIDATHLDVEDRDLLAYWLGRLTLADLGH